MVVHDLLRLVSNLVSDDTHTLWIMSFERFVFKCFRVHLFDILEFFLDIVPRDCHWFVRPGRWCVCSATSERYSMLTSL
jgi:hypothetical protein